MAPVKMIAVTATSVMRRLARTPRSASAAAPATVIATHATNSAVTTPGTEGSASARRTSRAATRSWSAVNTSLITLGSALSERATLSAASTRS